MQQQKTIIESEHSRAVRDMFSGIAGRYDLLNHLLSANIDKRWRRKVRGRLLSILNDPSALVLDVACGTGDLSIELKMNGKAQVIGLDFCRPMLAIASAKTSSIPFVEGDALNLSFGEKSFDAATIAFGLRNLANLHDGLNELFRILKPGGHLVILEFSSPVLPGFKELFSFYFKSILPRIGGIISGQRTAYEYLPSSVLKFPDQRSLAAMMEKTGFINVQYTNLTGGIAAIHHGRRP